MKILQINKYNFLKGGADTVFFNTIKLLEEHGNEVVRFTIVHPKNEKSKDEQYFVNYPEIRDLRGIDKLRSVARFIYNNQAARQLEQLLKNERPDVAHLHNIFNGLSLSILPILKKYKVPVVITMHDTRFICPSSYFNLRGPKCDTCLRTGSINCMLYRCYQDSFINSVMCSVEMFYKNICFDYNKYIDKYIFVSNRYLNLHNERHKYFKDKGIVLYNFVVNMEKISPVLSERKYLLYYGRVTAEKGVKTLFDAMRSLPQYTLRVVGTGPLVDELKNAHLPNVEFLGFKKGEDLFSIVKKAAYVIVPSEWEENNPLTIIEAYTYGTPVIGSQMGGIPEIIEQGKTGYTFEAFDSVALGNTIRDAMNINDDCYAALSYNARKFAEKHFNEEEHYRKLIEIYKSVIQ